MTNHFFSSEYFISAVSDSPFDRCYYKKNEFSQILCETFRRIFHFDCLSTISLQVLMIFPLLFTLYGFGMQQRLRNFYDKTRLLFIEFLLTLSFGAILNHIITMWMREPYPCLKWKNGHSEEIKNSFRTPNNDMFIITYISFIFTQVDLGNKWIRYFISLLIILSNCICSIFQGFSSISQVLITLSLTLWIVTFFRFIPPIGVIIFSCISIIGGFIVFGLNYAEFGWDSVVRSSLEMLIRGLTLITASLYLLIRYKMSRKTFSLFKVSWMKTEDDESSDDAYIPSMTRKDDDLEFAPILKFDLLDSSIAFFIYLIGNFGLVYDKMYRFFE